MDYWLERQAVALQNITDKSIKEVEIQLGNYYRNSMEKVIGQFEITYNKLLSSVIDGKQPTPADLYKLDKYWQLQGYLKTELQRLGDKQSVYISNSFEEQYKAIYEAVALPDEGFFTQFSDETAKQMVNQIWCADGKSWSNRIWDNIDKLQQTLNDNLIDCVLTGKKASDLKKILQEQFNVSYNRADSLVRTEMANIQTQAARQRYLDYGITEVEVLVDVDERTCPICEKLEGKRFPIGGKMPVPAHPRCRCCIVPYISG